MSQLNTRMFHIVEFVTSKEVDIVPQNWCNKEESVCSWPPQKPGFNITKAVMNCIDPSENWESYPIRTLYRSDNYNKARERLDKSADTSSLSTESGSDSESVGTSRKRIKPLRYLDESPEKSSPEIPNSNGTHKPKRGVSDAPPFPVRAVAGTSSMGSISKTLQLPSTSTGIYRSASTVTSYGNGILSPAATGHNTSTYTLENAMAGIEKVYREVQELRHTTSNIEMLVKALMNEKAALDNSEDSMDFQLPMESKEEVDGMDKKIQDNPKFRKKLVHYLSTRGGKDPQDATRKIIGKLLSNRMADHYNWAGRGGKNAFSALSLKSVIAESLHRNPVFQNTPVTTIDNAIKNWLKLSKLRGKKKEETVPGVVDDES